jgi:hypothetical protein
LAQKDANIAQREAAIVEQQAEITKARKAIEAEITARLSAERERITEEEAQRAQRIVATDLELKTKELAELNEVLKRRDEKLAEAQGGPIRRDELD